MSAILLAKQRRDSQQGLSESKPVVTQSLNDYRSLQLPIIIFCILIVLSAALVLRSMLKALADVNEAKALDTTMSMVLMQWANPVTRYQTRQHETLTVPVNMKQQLNTPVNTVHTTAKAVKKKLSKPKRLNAKESARAPANKAKVMANAQDQTEPNDVVTIKSSHIKLTKAKALLRQQDYDAAINYLTVLLQQQSDFHAARLLLLNTLMNLRQWRLAENIAHKAINAHPNKLDYRLVASKIMIHKGNNTQAIAFMEPLLDRARTDANILSLMALAQVNLEQFKKAAGLYQKLLALEPGQSRWWMGLALCQEKLGRHQNAIMAYQNVLADKSLSRTSKKSIENKLALLRSRL